MKHIKLFEANTKFKGHKYGPKEGGEVDIGLNIEEIEDYFLELEDAGWKITYNGYHDTTINANIDKEKNLFDIISPSSKPAWLNNNKNESDKLIKEGYKYYYYFWLTSNRRILDNKFSIMAHISKDTNVSHQLIHDILDSDISEMLEESIFINKSIKNIKSRLESRGIKAFFYINNIYHIKVSILIK